MANLDLNKDLQVPRKKKEHRGELRGVAVPGGGREELTPEARKKGAINRAASTNAIVKRKNELKEAMSLMLSLPATGKINDMLAAFGYEEGQRINASAVAATLFAMAMHGDMKAMEIILDYGFRISDDERKTKESDARISAMQTNGVNMTVNSGDDDGGVVIYLPALEVVDEVVEEAKETE